VEVDLVFSLTKSEVQVALLFWRVVRIFLRVIYEYVDIVFIEISYPLIILKVIFLKSKQTFDLLFLISVTYNLSYHI
jgi:hypothetical protein